VTTAAARSGRRRVFDGWIVVGAVSLVLLVAGGATCARVDADMVREATGFPIGGVPPFGHSTPLRVFVDPDLLTWPEVWAAAGTWNDVFGVDPKRLVEATGGAVVDLKR
jgi:prolyl-tRNA editing enzyme YbaK/EbsC (Cys-tRNA(Pro) deacylase)